MDEFMTKIFICAMLFILVLIFFVAIKETYFTGTETKETTFPCKVIQRIPAKNNIILSCIGVDDE